MAHLLKFNQSAAVKFFFLSSVFWLFSITVHAQASASGNLYKTFQGAASDSLQYEASRLLYNFYEEVNRDSALRYAEKCLVLARKNNKVLVEVFSLDIKGYQLLNM